MSTVLQIEDLSVRFGQHLALDHVSFSVETGDRVAIVGPNGAGKSTLFRAIVGMLPLESGRVTFESGRRTGGVGYLTQRSLVDWSFPVNVFDIVLMGRIGHMGWLRWASAQDRAIAKRCLEQVGLADMAGRQIGELSGGQQQRAFIARALAQEARLLLMDEPFSGVDLPSQEAILKLIDELKARGITILVSTHDLNLAVERFDKLALVNHHLIAYGPARQAITRETLTHAYGGQAVWDGDSYLMVMGDISCCGADGAHVHEAKPA